MIQIKTEQLSARNTLTAFFFYKMNQSEVRVQLQKAPRRSPASARPTDSGGKQHEKADMLFCANTRDFWICVFIAKVNVKVLAAKSLSRQCHLLSLYLNLLVSIKNIKTPRTWSKLGFQARSEGLDLSSWCLHYTSSGLRDRESSSTSVSTPIAKSSFHSADKTQCIFPHK